MKQSGFSALLSKSLINNKAAKKIYLISMTVVLFLCVSPNWAGTKYSCNVPLVTDPVIAAVHSTGAIFIDKKSYNIVIYSIPNPNSINGLDAYTNIEGNSIISSAKHDGTNNVIQEIYGRIGNTHYSYAAYLSSYVFDATGNIGFAMWNFVFFDPRVGADISKRNFAMSISCKMSTFNHNEPGVDDEVIKPSIVQNYNISRVVQDDFKKLYKIYNDPEATKGQEKYLRLIKDCKPSFEHVLKVWAFVVAPTMLGAACYYYSDKF